MAESNKIDLVIMIEPFNSVGIVKERRKDALSAFNDTERVDTYYYQGTDADGLDIEVVGYLSFDVYEDFYTDLDKFENEFQPLLSQGIIESGKGYIYNINNLTVKIM